MQEHYVTAMAVVEWTATVAWACRCGEVFDGLKHDVKRAYYEHLTVETESKAEQAEPVELPTTIGEIAEKIFGIKGFDASGKSMFGGVTK